MIIIIFFFYGDIEWFIIALFRKSNTGFEWLRERFIRFRGSNSPGGSCFLKSEGSEGLSRSGTLSFYVIRKMVG